MSTIQIEPMPVHDDGCDCVALAQDHPGEAGTMDGLGAGTRYMYIRRSEARDVAAKLLAFAERGG